MTTQSGQSWGVGEQMIRHSSHPLLRSASDAEILRKWRARTRDQPALPAARTGLQVRLHSASDSCRDPGLSDPLKAFTMPSAKYSSAKAHSTAPTTEANSISTPSPVV